MIKNILAINPESVHGDSVQRGIPTTITFTETGDFNALSAAQAWCRENGFRWGSLCWNDPIALTRGDVLIAKWKNLTESERNSIEGKMTSPDFRNGPVRVEIF